ncbi:MAG: DUF488 family protein [Chloroflexi bacterium]|nr:DUF488 family protein [Chloroflexota bacterium]
MIYIERVYGAPPPDGGARFLVDRLWPRGVKRETLQLTAWAKEAAPSDALRRWSHHDPTKWEEFRRRYFAELDATPEVWQPLLEAARQADVVLLYGARDTEHNNALALKEYVEARLAEGQ